MCLSYIIHGRMMMRFLLWFLEKFDELRAATVDCFPWREVEGIERKRNPWRTGGESSSPNERTVMGKRSLVLRGTVARCIVVLHYFLFSSLH